MSELLNLEPKSLWKHFDKICSIPHPSKHEEKIVAALVEFAKANNIEYKVDETGNVIMRKPASKGMENRKGVILQAHVDMVPQKNNDTKHDFVNDPIKPRIDGEWVRATGTTLGADNGIGASAALAVLEDKEMVHGPIEALFTIDEETGMTGAFGLKAGELNGDILLNLDSETEGELYVGCAGGIDATITFDFTKEAMPTGYKAYELIVKGMKGGHSGMDIILGRGNANKTLFRVLKALEKVDYRLGEINGGSLRNAIPREAFCTVAIPSAKVSEAEAVVKEYESIVKNELAAVEPEMEISLKEASSCDFVIDQDTAKRVVRAVYACPNGIYRMSDSMENLVETSSNLAIVKTDGNQIVACALLRSSVDTAKEDFAQMMASVIELAGGKIEFTGGYPGWKPNMNSPILETMTSTYKKLFGRTPKVMAIHAGLECGLLGGVYKNWDMISFGPTIKHPHSPDEKVNIESVKLFWEYLTETLKNVPTK